MPLGLRLCVYEAAEVLLGDARLLERRAGRAVGKEEVGVLAVDLDPPPVGIARGIAPRPAAVRSDGIAQPTGTGACTGASTKS